VRRSSVQLHSSFLELPGPLLRVARPRHADGRWRSITEGRWFAFLSCAYSIA